MVCDFVLCKQRNLYRSGDELPRVFLRLEQCRSIHCKADHRHCVYNRKLDGSERSKCPQYCLFHLHIACIRFHYGCRIRQLELQPDRTDLQCR